MSLDADDKLPPPLADPHAGFAAGELRGAIIGFGVIADGHVDGISAVAPLSVAAVVDPVAERRAAAVRRLPAVETLTSVSELPTGLDFLAICSPPHTHLNYIEHALRAGVPVLCEKPLVCSASEISAVEGLLEDTGGVLFPSHNYKYAPSLRALTDIVSKNRPRDEPVLAHFRTLRASHARGVRDWRPDWRRESAISGGGIVQDHGPHSVYLAMAVVGSAPVRVRCHMRRPSSGPYVDTEEFALIHLEFGDKSLVQIELDWSSPVRQTSYLVSGSWGHCRVIDDSLEWASGHETGRTSLTSDFNDPTHRAWFRGVWSEFLAATRDASIAEKAVRQALVTMRVLAGCYTSAAGSGDWVELS